MALATAMNILRVGILVFFDKKEGGGKRHLRIQKEENQSFYSILFYTSN